MTPERVETPVEGRANKSPERVKWRRFQYRVDQRWLQIGQESSRGSNREHPRESSEEDSSRGLSKEDRPVLPSEKTIHNINPVNCLTSVKIWSRLTEGLEAKTDRVTDW